jgi:hypothetical protein
MTAVAARIRAAFDDGSIHTASVKDLEEFILFTARRFAREHFGSQEWPHKVEVIRQALANQRASEAALAADQRA